jgi:hypothetical protein
VVPLGCQRHCLALFETYFLPCKLQKIIWNFSNNLKLLCQSVWYFWARLSILSPLFEKNFLSTMSTIVLILSQNLEQDWVYSSVLSLWEKMSGEFESNTPAFCSPWFVFANSVCRVSGVAVWENTTRIYQGTSTAKLLKNILMQPVPVHISARTCSWTSWSFLLVTCCFTCNQMLTDMIEWVCHALNPVYCFHEWLHLQ